MLTVGEMKRFIENEDDDKKLVFRLGGVNLEVSESYPQSLAYVLEMEESI